MNKITQNKNNSGFSVVELLLVILVVILLGVIGWMVYKNQKDKTHQSNTKTTSGVVQETTKKPVTTAPDPNEGYLVIKEWGIRFKVPSDLTDVQYQISKYPAPNGDGRLYFYAKPVGSTVQYRDDYMALNPNGYSQYTVGNLFRSTYSTQNKLDQPVSGKKIGDYYYYTSWAFSGLATGAGCVALYGNSNEANCQAEGAVFRSVNQGDSALLNTIEAAQ